MFCLSGRAVAAADTALIPPAGRRPPPSPDQLKEPRRAVQPLPEQYSFPWITPVTALAIHCIGCEADEGHNHVTGGGESGWGGGRRMVTSASICAL